MKKIWACASWLVLIACLLFPSFSEISRESTLITKPAEVIAGLGAHGHHMFYNIKEHGQEPDGQEGTIIQKYGLMGGVQALDTLTTEKGKVSFFANGRHGQLKMLMVNTDTQEIVFYDIVTEDEHTLVLDAGTYQIYLVGDTFSGRYEMEYQGMQVAEAE